MKLSSIIGYPLLVVVLFLLPLATGGSGYYVHVLILCAINIILASSLRAIATTGQISLGHAGFMSVGAYVSAIAAMKLGFSPYIGLLLGGLAAAAVAGIIAFPVSRVKTIYLAMLTLFLGEIIRLVITEGRGITGGTSGIINIAPFNTISILGCNIDFSTRLPNYYLILVIMLISLLFLYAIDRSYLGMTFKGIEQDESLAASTGIDVARYKAIILCIGCFFAGVAGSFHAHYLSVLTPDSFGIFPSIYIIVYVIVGGAKKFPGAVVGAFVLTLIPELFRILKEYQPLIFVTVLYLVVFLLPGGIVDLPELTRTQVRKIYWRKALNA